GAIQADIFDYRQALDQAGAAEQFEVIETLVARDVAGLGNGDGAGEEPAAGVAIVADALRDAGHPGEEGCVESVLQEDGAIEAFGVEPGGELAAGAQSVDRGVGD